jgi:hypothetical protein
MPDPEEDGDYGYNAQGHYENLLKEDVFGYSTSDLAMMIEDILTNDYFRKSFPAKGIKRIRGLLDLMEGLDKIEKVEEEEEEF